MVIGSIGVNPQIPSFKGIVKVNMVFDGNNPTYDKKVIDSATKQLKAILMKKNDTIQNVNNNNLMRETYNYFDNDYEIPQAPLKGSCRDIFGKVRTGRYGNNVFLVSGKDAYIVSDQGHKIGSKTALAEIDPQKIGLVDQAKDSYFSIKREIASRYYEDSRRPGIYLYTVRDNKNVVRLVGARMEDAYNYINGRNTRTKKIVLNPQYIKGTDTRPSNAASQKVKGNSNKTSDNTVPNKQGNMEQLTFDL